MDIQRPDTYFLQQSVERGIGAIIARLDPKKGFLPHFGLQVLPTPRLMHDIWDNGDMCARYADAFILSRQMTGNTGYMAEESAVNEILHRCDPYLHPFMATRVLIAFVDKYLQTPDTANKNRLDSLTKTIMAHMKYEGDYAYYFKPPEGWSSLKEPIFGNFSPYPTYPIGGIILALARYLEADHSEEIDEFLGKLVKFAAWHSGIFDEEGRYLGHTHSGGILTAAAGMARYAFFKKDARLIELMRGAFEWTVKHCSSWGWVPDGLGEPNGSCESCSVTDMLHFTLLMAKHVDPGYYEIAERYARNQLVENQFKSQKNIDNIWQHHDLPPSGEVQKALFGSWASWSRPNCLDNGLNMVEGCCLGAGIRGCFLVWDSAIEKKGDAVYVNMSFGRSSPWLEVVDYQPYEGRTDLIIKNAENVMVRIPSWADKKEVRATVGDTPVYADFEHPYLKLCGLNPGDHVKIQYPQRSAVIAEEVNGVSYSAQWRGDTVVGITPKGSLYPIFEREHMKQNTAPMLDGRPYGDQTGGPVFW